MVGFVTIMMLQKILVMGEAKVAKKMKLGKLALAVLLIMSIVAGCSSNNSSKGEVSNQNAANGNANSANETNESALEPYDLTMVVPVIGNVPKDVQQVQQAINEITQAKINTTVTLEVINVGNYIQQLNLKYSSGEKLDVAFIFGQLFRPFAAQGKFKDITDLVNTDGQGIIEAVSQKYVDAVKLNGKLYGVGTGPVSGAGTGYFMRQDIAEKYQIDASSIKTLEDIEKVLEIVKKNEPSLTPLALTGSVNPVSLYTDYDPIGDFGAVLADSEELQVVNRFGTQDYADRLNMVRKWFQAGYINKDAATTNSQPYDMVKAGTAFSYFGRSTALSGETAKDVAGYDMIQVELLPPYVTTSMLMTGLWTVNEQSEDPSRAMMFMNLLYTDKELVNTLFYGIEGEDYVKTSDNFIDFPEGTTAETVGYNLNDVKWMAGNGDLLYLREGDNPDGPELNRKWADISIQSKTLGFTVDSEPVKNEVVALNNVLSQYKAVLETGSVDPAKELPKFLDKLKTAGIDKYITEAQNQLDEWAASNK